MAESPKAVDVPIRIVVTELDDGEAQQRAMAEHVRRTGEAWIALADSLDGFADWLATLPRPEGEDAVDGAS